MSFSSFFDYPSLTASERPQDFVFLPTLSDDDWAKLLTYTLTRRFRAGEMVMEYGDRDRALYIVAEGSLEALVPRANGRGLRRVNTIEEGWVVGELAFFDGQPRSASVRALTDGELLCLHQETFEVLAAREPALARTILFDLGRILALRAREKDAFIAAWVK